jgi:hypothetical protein
LEYLHAIVHLIGNKDFPIRIGCNARRGSKLSVATTKGAPLSEESTITPKHLNRMVPVIATYK